MPRVVACLDGFYLKLRDGPERAVFGLEARPAAGRRRARVHIIYCEKVSTLSSTVTTACICRGIAAATLIARRGRGYRRGRKEDPRFPFRTCRPCFQGLASIPVEVQMRTRLGRTVILAAITGVLGALSVAASGGTAAAATPTNAGSPTCANVLGSGILVHGQHIVGDYVTGVGAVLNLDGVPDNNLTWPPAGQVGQVVSANGGAFLPGGPGPAFHFIEGLPPGASFCLAQAHPNGFVIPGPHGS